MSHSIAIFEDLMVAQLLVQDAGFQQLVDSRDPAELCQL